MATRDDHAVSGELAHGPQDGLVFVLSGPTGAGKTALVRELKNVEKDVHFCVTATTRLPRPGERHGVDYLFCSREEFERRVAEGAFLEWAQVPPPEGPSYGTPMAEVAKALRQGLDVFLQVDVQGAASVRARIPSAITIFLKPPNAAVLERRVRGRATENAAEMAVRLRNARVELERESEFDYSVVNEEGRLDEAVIQARKIIAAERAKRRGGAAPTSADGGSVQAESGRRSTSGPAPER